MIWLIPCGGAGCQAGHKDRETDRRDTLLPRRGGIGGMHRCWRWRGGTGEGNLVSSWDI
jgi:hypothetical protein